MKTYSGWPFTLIAVILVFLALVLYTFLYAPFPWEDNALQKDPAA